MSFNIQLLQQLISHLPNYVFWKDNNSIYQGCNNNFAKLIGLDSPEKIIGYTDDEIPYFKNSMSKLRAEDERMLKTGKTIIGRKIALKFSPKKEKIYLLDKRVIYDKNRHAKGILCVLTDVNEQEKFTKKLEKTLKIQNKYLATLNREVTGQAHDDMSIKEYADQLRSHLENIIGAMPGNVYWLDKNCVLLGGNDNLARMFGLKSRAELAGLTYQQMTELAHWTEGQGDSFRHAELEVMATGIPRFNVEEPPLMINGEKRYYMSNKVPLYNNHKEIIGVVGISIDITDKKLSEIALFEAKELAEAANKSKSEFIANMSHDIRTPLAGLLGMAKILTQEVNSQKGKKAARDIINAANILLDLLNSVIEFSKLESGELPLFKIKFSLKKLINNLLVLTKPSAQEKKINLFIHYDKKIPKYLIGDKNRIHRILLNLIGNAIKFTHSGAVKISIKLVKQSQKDVTLKFIVSDTGIGIPLDQQQNIFSKFSRLTPSYSSIYKGYGLGLSIVKQFISELNGKIEVKSQPEKGSTFTFIIALKKQTSSSTAKEPKKNLKLLKPELKDKPLTPEKKIRTLNAQLPAKKYKVLLVEDDRLIQLATKHQLKQLNCVIQIAKDGLKALSLAKQNTYDLIFMDIGLPGKSGLEVTEELKKWEKMHDKNTPVIALTAHIDKNTKQQCLDAGMREVLTKPLDDKKLQSVLKKYAKNDTEKDVKNKKLTQNDSRKIIDLKFTQEKFGYNKENSKNMLKIFMKSLNESEDAIVAAYQKSNLASLRFHIHKLHGGTLYCGVPRTQSAAKELEIAINEQYGTDRIQQLYVKLLAEIKNLKKAYKKYT